MESRSVMMLTELNWYAWSEWMMLSIAEHRHVYTAMETGLLPEELQVPMFSDYDKSTWKKNPITNELIEPAMEEEIKHLI